jgi:hypothetical protein
MLKSYACNKNLRRVPLFAGRDDDVGHEYPRDSGSLLLRRSRTEGEAFSALRMEGTPKDIG